MTRHSTDTAKAAPSSTDSVARTVSILIVAYRSPDQLRTCLDSVATHMPDNPVLVWDNSGLDYPGMDDVRGEHPDVRWFGDGSNKGFAAAVNALAAEVPDDHLLLLNPDAEVLAPLNRTLEVLGHRDVAAAAPMVVPNGDRFHSERTGRHRTWDVAHRNSGVVRSLVSKAGYAEVLRGTPLSDLYASAPDEVDGYLTGACLAIDRDAWNAVGEFDDEFFLYGEEFDWQQRARAAGWTVRLVDETAIAHSGAGTVAGDDKGTTRSAELLRANVALGLEHRRGVHSADLYLAGTSILDRVQRSRRNARRRTSGTARPSIVFTINRLVYGGAERHHVLLATELHRRGYDVTIAAMQRFGPLVAEIPHTVRVVRQPWWAPMVDTANKNTVVVSGDTNTEVGFASLWRASGRHRKWLVAAHIPPELDAPTYSSPLARAMARADGFVALSGGHWDQATTHQHLGDTVFVAPNGVVSALELPDEEPRRPIADVPHLVMLSRILEHKNPHVLVEALDGLRDLPWELSIYGDGPDRERLEALTPADLRDRIRWRGWSPGPQHALADCDLLCVPSRSEAFPMVILEAMARRIPVVASSVCAVPDMLDHGRAGTLVEPITVDAWRSTLAGLLGDTTTWPTLGLAGYDRMRSEYTIESMADAYEESFDAVLSEGSR
ncbi:glycosyltransferase [Rhodococcoides kyotonense]|uniref:Glycosyltransferase involved in cell wall bisynthesis n=1 Tax=Rhodococcoides kyotonense TaxID=398843 RepID=A0A239LM35_9NOCA|nr:glycosyltransferase [Rhodococcus kyotonensis]SNT30938.1 Glycosyltransferase involved in cell wall bisynthesis [Rhodococcus kyotonensis]